LREENEFFTYPVSAELSVGGCPGGDKVNRCHMDWGQHIR